MLTKLLLILLAIACLLHQICRKPSTLMFESIYVINLAHRRDRRHRIEALARFMNLDVAFLAAVSADSPSVQHILSHVREERSREGWCGYKEGCATHKRPPSPDQGAPLAAELRTLARGFSASSLYMPDAFFYAAEPQRAPLGVAGADHWPLDPVPLLHHSLTPLPIPALNSTTRPDAARSLRSRRTRKNAVLDFNTRPHFYSQPRSPLPWWRTVSPPVVACWHSHVLTLREFINTGKGSALILEDDVDLEIDLEQRLNSIRRTLPQEWDLIALGHCWSTEEAFAPLNASLPMIRPADSPKCNHAYAVTRSGAIRLVAHPLISLALISYLRIQLRHLRSPAFAYSRAFDQALVHLIVTDRIKAYSIVPSVAVQTKDTPSDIVGGMGSRWRSRLQHGVLRHLKDTSTIALL